MSDITNRMVVQALRVALWEEAKGKLRAIWAPHGFGPEGELPYAPRTERYSKVRGKIEKFIEEMEDEELQY